MRTMILGLLVVGLLLLPAAGADDQEPRGGGPCAADLNGDGATNIADLAALLSSYGLTSGETGFLEAADYDGNGAVTIADLAFLLSEYGCTSSVMVKSLQFSSTGFYNVAHDCASGTCTNYATPHYLDNNVDGDAEDTGDRMYPVAYVRNSYVTVSTLRFAVTPSDFSLTEVAVIGFGPDGLQFEGTGTLTAGVLSVTTLRSNIQLPNVAACYDPFEIEWQVALTPERYQPAGVSRNRMYVTLGIPSGRRLESFFDIGTRAAAGTATTADAVDAIWSEFTDLHVEDVDGSVMGYYRGVLCASQVTVYEAQGLVTSHNGQCGAWADLFQKCLDTQGITGSSFVTVEPINTNWLGILVNNYLFTGSGTSGCSTFPYKVNDPCGGVSWPGGADCTDAVGVPGQDNANPASFFSRHFIVMYGGKFYDPAYGAGPFTGTVIQANLAWEQGAMAGYIGQCGTRYGARKDVFGTRETEFTY
jgi:hypothetical protein